MCLSVHSATTYQCNTTYHRVLITNDLAGGASVDKSNLVNGLNEKLTENQMKTRIPKSNFQENFKSNRVL